MNQDDTQQVRENAQNRRQQVYVIKHELGPVKIGIAKSPKLRLTDLQVSCPFELRLLKTARPTNAAAVERYLHQRFSKYHIRGEWFDIPHEDLDFEIPTHIYDDGEPNTGVPITVGRDMDHDWGLTLERLYRSLLDTRHMTSRIRPIRREWRGWINKENDTDGVLEAEEPPDLGEAVDDVPQNEMRCASCGRHYDPVKGGCPICTSRASAKHFDF